MVWGIALLFSGVIAEIIISFQGLNDLDGYKILQIDIFCLLLYRKNHIGNTLWLFRQFYISVVYIYI